MNMAKSMPHSTPAIAVLGTASSVGKTTLAAALCRILSDDGVRVAPFKAQNMDSRVATLADGSFMSWAQQWQAKAARVEPITDMNPDRKSTRLNSSHVAIS